MRSRTLRSLALVAMAAIWAAAARAEVTVTEPWIRGMVAGQSATGAFMIIRSTDAVRLVEARSPVAQSVEIHKMEMDQGVMRMRPVDGLDIPAQGAVALKPNGYHVMLFGVAKPLMKGEKVPITLVFQGEDGKQTSTEVQAEVRALAETHGDMKMH
ncbi:MAG TPA: copper chaperone PCu(A)C [Burkholderiaceae bacterium]|nr:copper chaperone PCu(A)C [Burkholderiaceae bacterium]